jgi:hypothetical protein
MLTETDEGQLVQQDRLIVQTYRAISHLRLLIIQMEGEGQNTRQYKIELAELEMQQSALVADRDMLRHSPK